MAFYNEDIMTSLYDDDEWFVTVLYDIIIVIWSWLFLDLFKL